MTAGSHDVRTYMVHFGWHTHCWARYEQHTTKKLNQLKKLVYAHNKIKVINKATVKMWPHKVQEQTTMNVCCTACFIDRMACYSPCFLNKWTRRLKTFLNRGWDQRRRSEAGCPGWRWLTIKSLLLSLTVGSSLCSWWFLLLDWRDSDFLSG